MQVSQLTDTSSSKLLFFFSLTLSTKVLSDFGALLLTLLPPHQFRF